MDLALIERLMAPGEPLTAFLHRPSWHDKAACRDVETDSFFPNAGEVPMSAMLLCGTCPVATECLSYALSNPTLTGVWGGTSGESAEGFETPA